MFYLTLCMVFKTRYNGHPFVDNTHLLNSLPTHSEWQWTVWKAKDSPRQRIAPAKNAANTNFSCSWISTLGRVKK